ncbi:hypothetical protein ACSBR2_013480 [Camellia fascicularis]
MSFRYRTFLTLHLFAPNHFHKLARVFDLATLKIELNMGQKKKTASLFIRLVSAAGTGFFYVKRKNPKRIQTKLEFRKYDPRVDRHVLFTEAKMK